jgi:hypothetical protein
MSTNSKNSSNLGTSNLTDYIVKRSEIIEKVRLIGLPYFDGLKCILNESIHIKESISSR